MLDLFAAYLLRNDAIGVHIKGHTDDRGRPEDNQVLSENRAARWPQPSNNLASHPTGSPTRVSGNPHL